MAKKLKTTAPINETFITRTKKSTGEPLLKPRVVEINGLTNPELETESTTPSATVATTAATTASATPATTDYWQLPSELIVEETNSLGAIGEKIFFDRYAFKDGQKSSLKVGDTVIVCVDLKTGQREIGELTAIDLEKSEVGVKLRDNTEVTRAIEHIDKPLETKPEQMMDRIAHGIAQSEPTPALRRAWQEKFRWLLDGFKFVPAGRILAGAGTPQALTYYNCYVIPSPHDSRDGIIATLKQMNEIFSRGGGVGINLSSLRPRYAYVKGVNGRSSGAVSWGSLYSFSTGLIEQGGSRRGALMLIINVWHPDVLEFINSKREAGKITNANISVGITDDFMQAVENDQDWDLIFPDSSHPDYNEHWDGYLPNWLAGNRPTIKHKTVKARELWHQIIESAWASAEPGLFFIDRANKASNSWYYAPLICTNPCGEQPLPGWSVCNLGAINLAEFVAKQENGEYQVEWQKLGVALRFAVRFLDNVIDATPYFFDENEKQQKMERRVGLNTMGLAEMMIRLGIRYGSLESTQFINELYEFIATESYLASSQIASEKGSFDFYEAEKFLQSGYMESLPVKVRETIASQGIRNVTILTQAPNGTIGTMVGTSTGIEPFYSWTYFRKSRLGVHEENVAIVEEWRQANPNQELPDYFVTAMDLSPEEHVNVLAACQRWVDSAISKTSNVPNNYTVEQTADLYMLMYKLGCKGGTIYRDGSRNEQVLSLKETDHTVPHTEEAGQVIPRNRPEVMQGQTYRVRTSYGNLYITVNEDTNGQPFEIFAQIGKAGGFFAGQVEAISRLASLALRSGIEVHELIAQLKGIRGPQVSWSEGNMVLSLPDAIGQILERHLGAKTGVATAESKPTPVAIDTLSATAKKTERSIADYGEAPICPSCGSGLMPAEGCLTCQSCGWSKCT